MFFIIKDMVWNLALVGSTFVMVIVETRKSFTTGKEVLNANDNFIGRRGTNER